MKQALNELLLQNSTTPSSSAETYPIKIAFSLLRKQVSKAGDRQSRVPKDGTRNSCEGEPCTEAGYRHRIALYSYRLYYGKRT